MSGEVDTSLVGVLRGRPVCAHEEDSWGNGLADYRCHYCDALVVQGWADERERGRVVAALARVLAECDYAEEHQSQVMDDEVLVATGVIRYAARIVREQGTATGGGLQIANVIARRVKPGFDLVVDDPAEWGDQ